MMLCATGFHNGPSSVRLVLLCETQGVRAVKTGSAESAPAASAADCAQVGRWEGQDDALDGQGSSARPRAGLGSGQGGHRAWRLRTPGLGPRPYEKYGSVLTVLLTLFSSKKVRRTRISRSKRRTAARERGKGKREKGEEKKGGGKRGKTMTFLGHHTGGGHRQARRVWRHQRHRRHIKRRREGEKGGKGGRGGGEGEEGRRSPPVSTLSFSLTNLFPKSKKISPPAAPAAGWYGPYFLPASRAKQPYFPGSLALLSLCEHAKRALLSFTSRVARGGPLVGAHYLSPPLPASLAALASAANDLAILRLAASRSLASRSRLRRRTHVGVTSTSSSCAT